MSPARAILTGSLLIALAVLATRGATPALAAMNGTYQLSPHSNTTANVGVFKIDTVSGEVSYCYMSNNNALTCTGPVK